MNLKDEWLKTSRVLKYEEWLEDKVETLNEKWKDSSFWQHHWNNESTTAKAELRAMRSVAFGYRRALETLLNGDFVLQPESHDMRRRFIKAPLSEQIPEYRGQ